MKSACILLALALLLPVAFSSPANDYGMHFEGEAIDLVHQTLDHAPYTVSESSGKVFVGSIKSNKYHYPSCPSAKSIHPENEIWFSSSEDARAHGYVPCGRCHPP